MTDLDLARDLQLALGRVSRRLRRIFVDSGRASGAGGNSGRASGAGGNSGRASGAGSNSGEGLAFLELAVLHRVARGASSPSAMAEEESVTGAAVAASLTRLEGLGLVHRAKDERDGRRVVVTVTGAGRQVLEARDTAMLRSIHAVLQQFSAEERDRLAGAVPLLEKMARQL